jgi:hypothetical protein
LPVAGVDDTAVGGELAAAGTDAGHRYGFVRCVSVTVVRVIVAAAWCDVVGSVLRALGVVLL